MELTRRDALAALSAGGVGVGAGVVLVADPDDAGDPTPDTDADPGSPAGLDGHLRATSVAVARIVYPSAVSGIEAFVGAYLRGKADARPGFVSGAAGAVSRLDDLSESWHGGRFVDLDPATRETALREVGVPTAHSDPEGSPAERIRYYLWNELLYALYASPTGGELVGIENPQGHPGGTTSYQRGPEA
jgi:hypothetical protein